MRDNDFALYHNDIKSVDMSTDASSATISLMRNGDGTTSPAVDGTLTLTNGGGTDGKDTYVRISNTTNGQEVSKTFSTGSKVEAVGTKEATTGLTINGETYKIKTGQNYAAGDNITITGTKISANNNYVSSARLNNYDELILEREGLNDLTVDLSRLTRGLSSTDYQLVANKNSSDGKYTVRNGEVTLTVKDMNNLSNKEVKTITISGLAGKEDLTHYFSVKAPPAPLPGSSQIGNYDNDGATGERSIAIGVNASASGKFSVAIGSGQNSDGATTSGNYATAVGNGSLASGESSMALGYNAEAINAYSVAVGNESLVNGSNSMALGAYSAVGNQDSIVDSATAVGSLAHVYAEDGTALGENAEVLSKGKKGTALGTVAKVKAREGTAIGAYSSVSAEGGVAVGKGSVADRAAGMKGYAPVGEAGTSPVWKSTDGAVSLGSDSDGSSPHTRQITNLAAGTVDTDAVNVAQLKKARVELENGTNTTVNTTHDQTDGHVIYSVDVKTDGAINKGDTNIVTGDTVYNALQDVSWTAKVNGQVAKTVKKDDTLNFINGDNIAITSNNNGDIKISTTGLASSGDLWTAQAGGKDVTAVNQKVNFNSTDKHLVVESTKDGEITFATKDLADTSFTNITKEGNTYIKNLAKGEDRHIEAKEYAVGNEGPVTMTYVDGNGNTVDGTAKITGIAKSDLSNITNEGNTVINNIAKNAVKVIGGTNTAVETSTTDNGPVEYKVNLNKDVNLGDTIQLNGSDGSISAKSGGAKLSFGNNGLTVSQAKNGLTNETRINGAEITVDGGIGNQTIINGSTARIGSVLVNGGSGTATITGLTNKTTDYTGFANGSGRAATEEQLKEVDSKAAAAKTTVTNGKNITDDEAKADDGSSTYTVGLATDVVLGDNAIKLNGSDGSISAKSGGAKLSFNNNGLTVSQAKNGLTNETRIDGAEITVDGGIGNQTTIKGSMARIGSVLVNGGSGTATITGLTNKTTDYTGFANGSGRAATEEQLKEVAGKAGEAVETAGKGWNLTTNGKESSKTNIKPDGTVDFSSGNDNLVISNAGANLSFSLSDNLDLTNNKDKKGSVKVGENTALTDELLQVGKDVSLTASALNVGNSSLTTSALMVGGLTYINSSGINANKHKITNVLAGEDDMDAVNVGQLKSAISGSQVSIKAGDGISVNKAGNQYTINVNIEGLSNEHGMVHVSTDSDPSVVSESIPTESETITPAPAKRMNSLLLAEEAVAAELENGSSTGKKMYVKYTSNAVKLITDDITDPTKVADLNDGEEIFFSGDGNITTTTEPATEKKNTETIRFSLNKDVKVDSIEAKSGDQINIKSEVNMNNQKITNLKDGEIAEGSTDAVNGGQLYNTNQAVIANAENINSLSHSLNKLDSRINRVGADAAALAALHPLDFDPDNKWDFAAGYGNYAGANAVAIGTYYRPNENTMFSIGGSFGGGENMINAGVSFKLGSGGSGITTSKTVMAKKIKEQDELLKAQDAKMKEQDEKIAKLEALVAQQGEMIQQALGKK